MRYLAQFLIVQLVFLICAYSSADGLAVMSVDLGSEFMKIAIVKPGVPMEIVLNKESRRKTPLVVSLRGIEREFGENAMSQAIKNPKTAYLSITQLLGKSVDNPAVKAYTEKYPFYNIKQDPKTNTIYFQHDDSTTYTPEEILAMLLEYARELAADFGEQAIDAAVISVPAYFNQAERKAVLKAAEIANLRVLQLINNNIAAALNYGVFRRKDFNSTGTTLMFFDMGSTGTTATVATFQLVKSEDEVEANPQLTVRGVGFDRTLGGSAFSVRLANHLGKKFQEKTKKNPFGNPKAILKLYKEADRIKNILSANVDHVAQIENLMDDVDLKEKVTREEFETMCADLFERVKKPVEDALKYAEVLDEEITSVILVGGGTRIPKVQDELLKATKKKELGKNLNTDEAPALGAVYQAAFQSKGYKVKKFHIKDINIYPLVVDFEKHAESEADEAKATIVRRVLFERGNIYPKKKFITFNKQTSDFKIFVNYGDLDNFGPEVQKGIGSLNISEIDIVGVKDAFQKHATDESKGIKVLFKMDDSGVLRVEKIDASFEKAPEPDEESTLSKIGNTITSFFGGNAENPENPQEQPKEDTTQEKKDASGEGEQPAKPTEPEANAPKLNETASTINANKTTNGTVAGEVKPKIVKEDIKFTIVEFDLKETGAEAMSESRTKLKTIKEKEKEKKKRAAAINSLEAYIFDTRDKLGQDEFTKFCTPAEKETIQTKVDETDAWLSEADDTVETKAFVDKLTDLKSACKDVLFRINEKKLRPRKLDELKEVLNKSMDFLEYSKNHTGPELALTETEFHTLDKLIESTKEWRVKLLNEQAKVADNEAPKLLSTDITDKIDNLKREVGYLANKIKYFRPKTTKKPPTSTDEAKKEATDKETQGGEQANAETPNEQEQQNTEESIFNEDTTLETTQTTEEESTTTTDNPEL